MSKPPTEWTMIADFFAECVDGADAVYHEMRDGTVTKALVKQQTDAVWKIVQYARHEERARIREKIEGWMKRELERSEHTAVNHDASVGFNHGWNAALSDILALLPEKELSKRYENRPRPEVRRNIEKTERLFHSYS